MYGGIQLIESWVLLPLMMKRAVRIPPLVTLFMIVLWARLFGVPGLILAIPIDLTRWTFLDRFVLHQRE